MNLLHYSSILWLTRDKTAMFNALILHHVLRNDLNISLSNGPHFPEHSTMCLVHVCYGMWGKFNIAFAWGFLTSALLGGDGGEITFKGGYTVGLENFTTEKVHEYVFYIIVDSFCGEKIHFCL